MSWICIVLLGIVKANAQITLSAGDYPTETLIGIDSLKKTVYNTPFPSFSGGADLIWDLSSVLDTTPTFLDIRVPSVAYQYADSSNANFITYNFLRKTDYSIVTNGLLEYLTSTSGEKYDLFSLTSAPTDSLFIPSQTNLYTSPRKVIAFPCTNLSTWSSQYSSDFHFELSIAGYSLTHEPAIRRTYTQETSTVTGYGKMRVKDATGAPSSYFHVLQVKTITTTIDSFFLNGSPMPLSLLGLFMLNQGHTDTIREQNYYRKGEITPLAKVEFRDDAFNQPYRATTHMQRLISVGITTRESKPINIFPNPASDHLSVELPFTANWQYQLIDILGKTIVQGAFFNQGLHTIPLSSLIPDGHYMLKVSEGTMSTIQQIDIIK